ncbi:hypothetical protein HDV02_004304 [Globomyces sp. JEL0801]|nr:hypothetical protein HDV02_004304 [Globomyces sp. JEL0801]
MVMTRGETKFLGNRVSLSTYDPIKRQDYELTEIEQTPVTLPGSTIKLTHGNFALSSCPAMIARDLVQDLERISSLNIKTIICCLDNKELEFLGAPWKLYKHEAQKLGMNVIRLPIVEGKSPKSVEEVDALMEQLDDLSPPNHHILCHCRGGIGRAGLLACCFLIRKQYCKTADSAIRLIRQRRSPKAIETIDQERFIHDYFEYCRNKVSAQ